MITAEQFQLLSRHFPVFGEFPVTSREVVMQSAVPFQLEAGAVAFDSYASCESFPMLVEGRIRVAKPAPNGREILLYRVEPGQTCVLTLNCLLSDAEYNARGVAAIDCRGFALPQSTFLRLIQEHKGFRDFIFRTLSRRVLELMELVEEVAFNRLDQRLAKLLAQATRSSDGTTVEKTHQQIADEIGSVREIVSRILGSFADEGLVRLERGRVVILDPAGLQRVFEHA